MKASTRVPNFNIIWSFLAVFGLHRKLQANPKRLQQTQKYKIFKNWITFPQIFMKVIRVPNFNIIWSFLAVFGLHRKLQPNPKRLKQTQKYKIFKNWITFPSDIHESYQSAKFQHNLIIFGLSQAVLKILGHFLDPKRSKQAQKYKTFKKWITNSTQIFMKATRTQISTYSDHFCVV